MNLPELERIDVGLGPEHEDFARQLGVTPAQLVQAVIWCLEDQDDAGEGVL